MILGLMLLMAQDIPPLAGSLPPMPPPRSGKPNDDRPRGRLFISPMGEPFRGPDPVRAWFDAADTDHDGAIAAAEFLADAARFFAVLDRGKDGEIDPDDIAYYETVLAPEIRSGGEGAGMGGGPRGGGRRGGGKRGGGGGGPPPGGGGGFGGEGGGAPAARYGDTKRGAARFSFFDYPEPVTVADANFNRGIDPREFRDAAIERFGMLDKNRDGRITLGELPRLAAPPTGGERGRGGARPAGPPPGSGDGGSGDDDG